MPLDQNGKLRSVTGEHILDDGGVVAIRMLSRFK